MRVRKSEDPKCKSHGFGGDAVGYLLAQGGGFGQTTAQVSENHWPLAAWAPCHDGRDYGVMWSDALGPTTLRNADIANADFAPTCANVIKLRR